MPVDASGPARTVNVRPLEAPPFETVVDALGELETGETVEVVAGVAPIPLYDALEARGWTYESVRVGPAEWRVRVAAGEDDDGAGRPGERAALGPTGSPRRTLDMSETKLDVRDERHACQPPEDAN